MDKEIRKEFNEIFKDTETPILKESYYYIFKKGWLISQKEATERICRNINGFLGTGGNIQNINVNNLRKYATDQIEETNKVYGIMIKD